jgi:hypothetical protein
MKRSAFSAMLLPVLLWTGAATAVPPPRAVIADPPADAAAPASMAAFVCRAETAR